MKKKPGHKEKEKLKEDEVLDVLYEPRRLFNLVEELRKSSMKRLEMIMITNKMNMTL